MTSKLMYIIRTKQTTYTEPWKLNTTTDNPKTQTIVNPNTFQNTTTGNPKPKL